jgi:hypothetical protein
MEAINLDVFPVDVAAVVKAEGEHALKTSKRSMMCRGRQGGRRPVRGH